jgi:hypothetical protein
MRAYAHLLYKWGDDMSSNTITRMSAALGAGNTAEFDPGAGRAWEVNYVGSDAAFVAGGLYGSVPDVEIGLKKGAATCIICVDPTTDPGNRAGEHRFLVNHSVTLTVKNTAAGAANVSIIGQRINPLNVLSDIIAVGAGGSVAVDPGVGQGMLITEMGYSVWSAFPADVNPDMMVGFTDGTLIASIFWDYTQPCGHDQHLELYTRHECQLYVTDGLAGAGGDMGFCAERTANVISSITDVANGANLDIKPTDGIETLITGIAAEKWTGAAPAGFPNSSASIRVGANNSGLVKAGLSSEMWDSGIKARIDNTNYMRINNADAAFSEIAVLGVNLRQYKS